MSWVTRSLVVASLLSATAAYAGNASGSYIGRGQNAAFMIQLVEGERGNLTGRYVQVRLSSQGAVEETNSSVTGVVDGQTVVVTIKPTELLAGSFTASGKLDGSGLDLSGGGYGSTLTLHLRKSDQSEFQSLVASLRVESQKIADAKNRADTLNAVRKAISKVAEISKSIEVAQTKLDTGSVAQRYRSATEWMRNAQGRQNTILGEGQASVARSQIGVSINQAAIQVEQFHLAMQTSQGFFHSAVETLGNDHAASIRVCREVVANADSAPSPELRSVCIALIDSLNALAPRIKTLESSYQAAEAAWSEERRKQGQILKASEYASR